MRKRLRNVYVKGEVFVKDDVMVCYDEYDDKLEFKDLIIEGNLYIFGICYVNEGIIGATNEPLNGDQYEIIKGDYFLGKKTYLKILRTANDITIKSDLPESKLRKEKIMKIFNE